MEGPTFTGREGKGPNSKGDGMEEREDRWTERRGRVFPPPSQDE